MTEALDPAAVEALYAESPGRFIEARHDLVERLKEAGALDTAREARALRKPTTAAWAVNRIAREHPREMEALIAAGKDLASAQREVASGGSVDRLREAASERRRLVDLLVRAASQTLKDAGMAAARATLDEVSSTLMAIATNQEAAERVRRGVLDKELPAPAGFGDEQLDAALLASVSELPRRAGTDGAGDEAVTPAQQRKEREARRRADRLAAEAAKLERDAVRLERVAEAADAKATDARLAAALARRQADAARYSAEKASPQQG